jgi:hypothetical protein
VHAELPVPLTNGAGVSRRPRAGVLTSSERYGRGGVSTTPVGEWT